MIETQARFSRLGYFARDACHGWEMQNRYVGDIGDYLKLGILRALSPGYHLGVAWWLFPDEAHNRDGRHIRYLSRPDRWRHFDPDLFDTLRGIVSSGRRN